MGYVNIMDVIHGFSSSMNKDTCDFWNVSITVVYYVTSEEGILCTRFELRDIFI